MKAKSFLIPVIVSLVVTPIALLLGIGSGAAGHGDYFFAKMLFPYTMLSTAVFDSITFPFIALAIVQFPFYGVALGWASQRGRLGLLGIILVCVHGFACLATLYVASPKFSGSMDALIVAG